MKAASRCPDLISCRICKLHVSQLEMLALQQKLEKVRSDKNRQQRRKVIYEHVMTQKCLIYHFYADRLTSSCHSFKNWTAQNCQNRCLITLPAFHSKLLSLQFWSFALRLISKFSYGFTYRHSYFRFLPLCIARSFEVLLA